jgi:hypothetical protein
MSFAWFKFYPTDWRADPALRLCSIGARGLWMEMLCVMHEAAPRGYLIVNGTAVTETQLAGLAGISQQEAASYLAELEAAGVFSRADDGTIFSRRMRRDDEKAERHRANGRAGGNPTLRRGVNPAVNPRVNPRDKARVNPEVKAQKPDTRSQDTRSQKSEYSEPDGSGAGAPRDDPRARLFRVGLATLGRIAGRGPDSCRSLVGKWLKAAGDDPIEVLAAIEDAERNQVIHPVQWIEARFRSRAPPSGGRAPRPGSREDTRERTINALRKLKDYARSHSDDEARGGDAGRSSARLLSDPEPARSRDLHGDGRGPAVSLPAVGGRAGA